MQQSILFIFILLVVFVEAKQASNEILRNKTELLPTFDKSSRARQLELGNVFQYLKIRRHYSSVADVGAGTGWLTVRLAAYVSPKGKVYAVETVSRYIPYIKGIAKLYNLNNVQAILGSLTDPKLPEKTLDAVIILISYHEFEKPITMLNKIHKAMKIGARLGIIERDTDEMQVEAREAYAKTGYILHRFNETVSDYFLPDQHYIARDIVVREVTSVGFTFLFYRQLDDDYYITVFAKA